MDEAFWEITSGDEPILAAAIHDGHDVRDEVARLLAVSESHRLREEDPYTRGWTEVAPNRIVSRRSRFEVDLNRPRDRAVYRTPDDAWGIKIYMSDPPPALVERSLALYDAFYAEVERTLSDLVTRFGVVAVLDLHTYNHRRAGPRQPPAEPTQNPEVNVGTGTLDRASFGSLAERFMRDLQGCDFLGRHLDVRENVKFRGGRFSTWIHETFPGRVCALAIEFKKFFMDEWTGELRQEPYEAIQRALSQTVPGIQRELQQCRQRLPRRTP
jgi:N-formylglutamate deformylase